MPSLRPAGVHREYYLDRNKPNEEQWFRDIWYSECGKYYIIVCCTKEQAEQFQFCDHVEMDMSFKMVAGKTTVFSFVGWCTRAKRKLGISLTYAQHMLI
jgi:hypothetical protein